MKIHEYQAKELFRKGEIRVPRGEVVTKPEAAYDLAAEYGKPVVVKAQVLVGGRGKAGGVKVAGTPDEARKYAQAILGMQIKGLTVEKVLVTEAVDIAAEMVKHAQPLSYQPTVPVYTESFSDEGGYDPALAALSTLLMKKTRKPVISVQAILTGALGLAAKVSAPLGS